MRLLTDQRTAGSSHRNFQQATATFTCCGSWLSGRRRLSQPWSPCRAGECLISRACHASLSSVKGNQRSLRPCLAELSPCLPCVPAPHSPNARRCCSQDVESAHTLPLRCAKWAARGVRPKAVNGESSVSRIFKPCHT